MGYLLYPAEKRNGQLINLKILTMKKLEKSEMKNLKGGRTANQSGYILQGSNCYCDYTYTYPNGSTITYCYQPCATSCCTSGMSCALLLD